MSRIPPRYYSMAGAARTTVFQLGLAVGIAVAVSIVNAGDATLLQPYRVVWLVAAAGAAVAAVLMLTLFPAPSSPVPLAVHRPTPDANCPVAGA